MRKFAVCKGYEEKGINLPKRGTAHSAGYDFEAAENIEIPTIWRTALTYFKKFDFFAFGPGHGVQIPKFEGTLIKTGVKAYFEEDEKLNLYARSSIFNKFGLILANGVGVVESDYADNPSTDGNIMFNYINFGLKTIVIKKGEKIGQGVFSKFLITDDDKAEGVRTGGFGSTDK